jgi:methylated-DNA-[protein]-cysteine S-methyltransferase
MSDFRQQSGWNPRRLDGMTKSNGNIHATMDSPAGRLLLVGRESATGVELDSVSFTTEHDPRGSAAFGHVQRQLAAYFVGELTRFDVPHTERGTEFQRRVWAAVDAIPYGTTISYGELARRVGAPRERVRAVAAAVGANPLLVVRPCHRVIGADGSLTGYAGGVPRKEFLLALEGVLVS